MWAPVVVWAGLIFIASSIPDHRPAGSTGLPELMSRKLAHLVEYGVLAYFVARALTGMGWAIRRVWAVGLLACVLYAISDEVHQSFVPGRFGKVRDVALDSLGAALVISLYARRQMARQFSPSLQVPDSPAIFSATARLDRSS
ncbi:MAG: VanZ family protein [Elusimicrobia bacterium]|nr:VanZ family protein [Elusimicrobiota bacterium]